MSDKIFMQYALDLAVKAKGATSPNPLVGAVIVKHGKIIAQGWHRRAGGQHAEIEAIQQAGLNTKGAKLFVTLEPCFHYGRTPPCVDAIIKAKIKEVVIGMKDPNPLTDGKSIAKLRRSGITVRLLRLFQAPCARVNEVFIKYIQEAMPFVVAKSAQTLDGKIALASGQSKWITSEQSRLHARKLRNEFDAILVGINTVIQDDPWLTAQNNRKVLKKIILDTHLKISLRARLLRKTAVGQCIIFTTDNAPAKKIEQLRKKGVEVIVAQKGALKNRDRTQISVKWLLKELAKKEIISVLIEGGARTIGLALKSQCVDKMHIYVSPKIVGDQEAISSIIGVNTKVLDEAVELRDLSVEMLTSDKSSRSTKSARDIFISGYVHRYN